MYLLKRKQPSNVLSYSLFFLIFIDPITTIDSLVITNIACGDAHSMALNEWGQLYTWGSDACCQLGNILSMYIANKNCLI